MLQAAVDGFLLGGGLIVAIGAQNAFVLRQGLLRQHVFPVALFCGLSDALLIGVGVAGFGAFVLAHATLLKVVAWGGAAFLFVYGFLAFRRAMGPSSLRPSEETGRSLQATLTTCAAFTFLNPHVYLDTVVLVGGLSATYGDTGRIVFGLGAATASFVWFFSLAYGARLLVPLFEKPFAWRVLDTGVGIVMWLLAIKVISTAP